MVDEVTEPSGEPTQERPDLETGTDKTPTGVPGSLRIEATGEPHEARIHLNGTLLKRVKSFQIGAHASSKWDGLVRWRLEEYGNGPLQGPLVIREGHVSRLVVDGTQLEPATGILDARPEDAAVPAEDGPLVFDPTDWHIRIWRASRRRWNIRRPAEFGRRTGFTQMDLKEAVLLQMVSRLDPAGLLSLRHTWGLVDSCRRNDTENARRIVNEIVMRIMVTGLYEDPLPENPRIVLPDLKRSTWKDWGWA